MDTSETYIKMCNCLEIQELRREEKHKDTGKWQGGDFWTTVFKDKRVFVVARCNDAWADEPHYLHHPIECIWLPRQDQLQEMVGATRCNTIEGFNGFCGLINEGRWFIKPECFDYSMEQLWLAFVMKERFGKIWSGTEWLDEDAKG